jgi:hypothetical protein
MAEPPTHQASHQDVIAQVPNRRGRSGDLPPLPAPLHLGGVIIPTSRPYSSLSAPFALPRAVAAQNRAALVLLRSGEASSRPVPRRLLEGTGAPVVVVDLPAGYELEVPFLTDGHLLTRSRLGNDVGLKRNLGLLLAVLCDWPVILFLDDDIKTEADSTPSVHVPHQLVRPDDLRAADVLVDMAVERDLLVAAFQQKDYDDNSVVCHARRLIGLEQGIFPSGGAMYVRTAMPTAFFPTIYNEDWLYFFMVLAESAQTHPYGSMKVAGVVHQDAYPPFVPARARREEPGDSLGEGLFRLLEGYAPRLDLPETERYWRETLMLRRKMLHELMSGLLHHAVHRSPLREPVETAEKAVEAALDTHRRRSEGLRPAHFVSYVDAMWKDLDNWRDHLEEVRPGAGAALDVESALERLRLLEHSQVFNHRRIVLPPVPRESGETIEPATDAGEVVDLSDGSSADEAGDEDLT